MHIGERGQGLHEQRQRKHKPRKTRAAELLLEQGSFAELPPSSPLLARRNAVPSCNETTYHIQKPPSLVTTSSRTTPKLLPDSVVADINSYIYYFDAQGLDTISPTQFLRGCPPQFSESAIRPSVEIDNPRGAPNMAPIIKVPRAKSFQMKRDPIPVSWNSQQSKGRIPSIDEQSFGPNMTQPDIGSLSSSPELSTSGPGDK